MKSGQLAGFDLSNVLSHKILDLCDGGLRHQPDARLIETSSSILAVCVTRGSLLRFRKLPVLSDDSPHDSPPECVRDGCTGGFRTGCSDGGCCEGSDKGNSVHTLRYVNAADVCGVLLCQRPAINRTVHVQGTGQVVYSGSTTWLLTWEQRIST